ncbi:TetR/AcrR family transcriptional regulator [Cupriavidus metallidurans]|uniref:TetR/AcrR family transcriptional regulator n=1 Tax=Cupriavidus TaxID=106589 RepID=UPI000E9F9B85|nr:MULTISPECIES: TetR/AcrR family transcriptional regulator [unclassified Cupriavidus]GMG93445.1 TetR family transcriptional regulator [Cupriavidus sp. TKC]HBO81801.1 TetR family transcriptional regulator [Cupriavidus sp.]
MARPRQFDAQTALSAAQDAFWAKGYHATSTRELTQAMGLTQPSLYNAFGDKRTLFLQALEDYLNHTLRERIARLEGTLPPAQALEAFFAESIERGASDPQHRGCMLINTALDASADDPELAAIVAEELTTLGHFFERTIRAGQADGSIDPTLAARDASATLLSVQIGLRVMSRVMPDRALLEASVRPVLALLRRKPHVAT